MNRFVAWALFFGLVVAPVLASADYLYRLPAEQQRNKPYVLVILDTSYSMTDNNSTDERNGVCPYGYNDSNKNGWKDSGERCYNRLDAAKQVVHGFLPKIAPDVELGLMVFSSESTAGHYGKSAPIKSAVMPTNRSNPNHVTTTGKEKHCGVQVLAPLGSSIETILSSVTNARSDSSVYTPLGWSIKTAREELIVHKNKPENGCRDFYILLLTDGEEYCGTTSIARTEAGDSFAKGIRTFVIGFGKGVAGNSTLSGIAQRGGTSVNDKGEFVCWDNNNCGQGTAMFASQTDELEEALTRAFEVVRRGTFSAAEPVIASVPQVESEIDRVARNLLVYAAFHQDAGKMEGHLFGLRLFKENSPYSNDWQFTDMDGRELLERCGPDYTCLFDAGRMLQNRTKPRKIFTARSDPPTTTGGMLRFPRLETVELGQTTSDADIWRRHWWGGEDGRTYASMPYIAPAMNDLPPDYAGLKATLEKPASSDLLEVIRWLHGDDKKWRLADIYHGSPSIVEPPSLSYLDRGYPQFRRAAASRPWMIYVGANDGMIHAFHASPDFDWEKAGADGPRWEAGEEAWAYLPVNLWARTLAEVKSGKDRFYSQDLSCRFTDVILDDPLTDKGLDCGDDPYCGWGTVLMCGQGWGGSWYVALDVTNPFEPKPLWEFTMLGGEPATGTGSMSASKAGLGRTWSVPAITLMNNKGKPTWAAIFGNGYNSTMETCSTSNCNSTHRRSSYRVLNMPFEGVQKEHGVGTKGDEGNAYVVDAATGALLKHLPATDLGAVLADVATIDSNRDGLVDAAYLGGMYGYLGRVSFGKTPTGGAAEIGICTDFLNFGKSKPITSNPSVVAHSSARNKVYLFVGTGVDAGSDPDQQDNQGKMWEFHAYQYQEDGTAGCKPSKTAVCSDGTKWKLDDSARLLGQPLFSRQLDGRDFVLYSTWSPTKTSCSTSGVARLHCLDVTSTSCKACGDLDGDGSVDRSVVIDTGGVPPTSPVIADGNAYVGYKRVEIKDEDGNTAPPNASRSRTVTLSWREVF